MTTRRREKRRYLKRLFKILFWLILPAVFLWLVFSVFRNHYWDGVHGLNLAVGGGRDVYVISFSPADGEITKIIIPGSTELELARNLGVMKVKNIWALGFNEGFEGDLLAETLTRNLRMSVYAWGEVETDAFWNPGWKGLFKAVMGRYETNLSLGDKFRMAVFAKSVKDYKRTEIDLAETSLLTKTRLNDGEEGYVLTARFPREINILASDARLTDKKLKIKIIDSTGKKGIAESVGKIIESLGAKITLIEEKEPTEGDCTVYSDRKEIRTFLRNTFGCKEASIPKGDNFDVEIFLEEAFAERY